MQIGMIGLGRMGMNMARRLVQGGHEVLAFNRSPAKTDQLAAEGGLATYSLKEFVSRLEPPRTIWIMLPAGTPVDEHIKQLTGMLDRGDLIVDGGNSNFKDDIRRAEQLKTMGLLYADAGVSGGIWGLTVGYCTMVGGPAEAYERLRPALDTLAPPEGHLHCGAVGAGHFVKMIHNGIEYGMMQAYAEGFALLEASPYGKGMDFGEVAHLWNQGSVVRSWLLELAETAFAQDGRLEGIAPYVEDSGEGRWTVDQAVELGVSAPVLTLSLMERFRSRDEGAFADRLLAALRNQFGGHAIKKSGE
ncbi:phosphogluconate dehydrogenase (NAD(+)-dependent, decarboxylating) [Desulfovibrio ferrophilus]|nr:decarboxylating 6-phosphogluconate dehydrogenase [Desulfovibrio ferrophilus]